MSTLGVDAADYTAMNSIDQTSQTPTDFKRTVNSAVQDHPGSTYTIDWAKWFGYYKNIPELQAAINKKAIWTLGRGYQADEKTEKTLDRIRGNGKDTFNDIMHNLVVQFHVCGDAFAEIVRNKRGDLTNIKPISPATMAIISNPRGMITGYEQTVEYQPITGQKKNATKKFETKEIFHLQWNRLGDEPHGRSDIEKLVDIIDARNEALKDIRIVFHRYVKPLIISSIDTDDATEISAFKTKLDKAVENMENLIVPKDTVSMERMSIPQYSTLDPLPYIKTLQEYFLLSEGIPEIILGLGRDTTEASAKIIYLAFQQNIEHCQRFIEDQMKKQLRLDVEFNFPENIGPELAMDIQKERNLDNMSETGGGNLNGIGKIGTEGSRNGNKTVQK